MSDDDEKVLKKLFSDDEEEVIAAIEAMEDEEEVLEGPDSYYFVSNTRDTSTAFVDSSGVYFLGSYVFAEYVAVSSTSIFEKSDKIKH